MLRKALYLLLALLMCALVVTGIDAARHARAIQRLIDRRASLGEWHYRLGGAEVVDPIELNSDFRKWLQYAAASPRAALFGQYMNSAALDESAARDLATIGVEGLELDERPGLWTAAVAELCGRSPLRQLVVHNNDISDEGLCLIWSGLPDLEMLLLTGDRIGENGFRGIGQARKLNRLLLDGRGINDRTIARVAEAPALRELSLGTGDFTEASAAVLAAMPALREVDFLTSSPAENAGLIERLKMLNPKLKVEVTLSPQAVPGIPESDGRLLDEAAHATSQPTEQR